MEHSEADPKGLIRESYRIGGITAPECRSIFIDWALSLPQGTVQAAAIRALIAAYAAPNPAHPMTAVLTEALDPAPAPARRGGRAGRFGGGDLR